MIGVIAWREFRAHGHNLTLWLLLAALQGMLAWLLFAQLDAYRGISAQLVAAQSSLGINDLVIAPSLNSLGILLLLATPLLGMHALSDERRSGHLQVLLSSPLSVTQLLLGKWLGNVLGGLFLLAAGLLIPLTLASGAELDLQRLGIGALGLTLLVMMSAAITLMFSAFTRHAQSAFAASAGVLLSLWLFDSFVPVDAAGYWLALNPHLQQASAGSLSSMDGGYFLLLTAAPLLIAGVGLAQNRGARHNGPVRLPLFALLSLACLMAAGSLLRQHDTPLLQAQSAQIPKGLRQALAALEGPVVITAFAPELPLLRKRIDKLVSPLQPHYRQLELRFVDPRKQPHLARAQNIQADGELVIEGMNRRQQLRNPNRGTLQSALERIARKGPPWVLVLQGQGEARIDEPGRTGLSAFVMALERQGYRVLGFNPLTSPQIPHNAAFVMIPGSRQAYAASTVQLLDAYLHEGGRILWLHEGENDMALQKLSGVQRLPGRVLDPAGTRIGLPSPRQLPVTDFPRQLLPRPPQQHAVLSDTVALTASRDWDSVAQLRTSPQAWNETGALGRDAQRDPLYGERQGPLILGQALKRGQSRIMLVGDSDFVRNDQFGRAGNRALAMGLVNWLTDNQLSTAQPADDLKLTWDQDTGALMAAVHMFILPLLYLLAGLLVRRQRLRA